MNKKYYPRCPICKAPITIDELLDCRHFSNKIAYFYVGHCSDCGKTYTWEDVYNLAEHRNLTEYREG